MRITPQVEEMIRQIVEMLRDQSMSAQGTKMCLQVLWTLARERNSARKSIADAGGHFACLKAMALHPGDHEIVRATCGILHRMNKNEVVRDMMVNANPIPVLYGIGDIHEEDPAVQQLVCLALSAALQSSGDKNTTIKNAIDVGTRCCKVLKRFIDNPDAIEGALACLGQVLLHLPLTRGNLTVSERNGFITPEVVPLLVDAMDVQDTGAKTSTEGHLIFQSIHISIIYIIVDPTPQRRRSSGCIRPPSLTNWEEAFRKSPTPNIDQKFEQPTSPHGAATTCFSAVTQTVHNPPTVVSRNISPHAQSTMLGRIGATLSRAASLESVGCNKLHPHIICFSTLYALFHCVCRDRWGNSRA